MNQIVEDAIEFIRACYSELNKTDHEVEMRITEITDRMKNQGFYEHTTEELEYGARVAWRNSNRCIGRLFWNNLTVVDKRNINTEDDIAQALFDHIDFATNKGRIRPTITIFSRKMADQEIRIWNHQLFRYAGYRTEHGIIGDPDSLDFTEVCIKLGWEPKFGTFDMLPIVIQINDNPPRLYNIPDKHILEVPLKHPNYQWFEDLQLKWYAVPIISNMSLEIGGITYSAAPFNGWYMGTEIGARNLADEKRYNMLPKIGVLMKLDINNNTSMWQDRALIELNAAVLHSYKEKGVTIVDHHTAAQQFEKFEDIEMEKGREVTGNWAWLIPPLSPATTHVFHKRYKNDINKPNYFYQTQPY